MFRFYVSEADFKEEIISLKEEDVNHVKNVLRMNIKDKIIVCDCKGHDAVCEIHNISQNDVKVKVLSVSESEGELPCDIILFQGLPKKDKMELIIQKAVELGVTKIVPVTTKHTVVKIENEKKEKLKLDRWLSITRAAAKQSQRGIIPVVGNIVTFDEAVDMAAGLEKAIIPYEKAEGISKSRQVIGELFNKKSVGVFIGPEGGFAEEEINKALSHDIIPVTLGKRILRTETAGLTILSILMFGMESD